MPRANTKEEFWSNVRKGKRSECWEWNGLVTARGHLRTRWKGDEWPATHLAFYLHTGKKPRCIVQTCSNRKCVNPKHLERRDAANQSTDADFWNAVDKRKRTGCWPWTKAKNRFGYGVAYYKGATWRAHRLAFFLATGKKPQAVCHRCDFRLCVRPDHLWAGTKRENNIDRDQKGRQAVGEKCGTAKLTNKTVCQMRDEYSNGGTTFAKMGQKYGVTSGTAYCVVTRKTWTHI